MIEPIITINDLSVIYNQNKSNEIRALKQIGLKIFPHEYIIIHGPSGCGKSTLLYSMAGLQTPTSGEVIVAGDKVHEMSSFKKAKFRQKKIGMIFQAFHLIPSLSILHNVTLPLVFEGVSRKERDEKGIEILRRFSIVEQKDKLPNQLSGGQKQRVAIARALINNPEIILADEPVGNLDSVSAQNVLQILKDLNEIDKKTILMVTHNKSILHYADRIVHMKDGEIVDFEINESKKHNIDLSSEQLVSLGNLSNELRLLIRTFRDLSYQQAGMLIVPFKAKQLVSHILSNFTHEQIELATGFVKEFLFNNISEKDMLERLDQDIEKGGAGWNKQKARSFTERVKEIVSQAAILRKSENSNLAVSQLGGYLINYFKLNLEEEKIRRFIKFLKLRIEDKIDMFGLIKRLDSPYLLGGMGFYKNTAKKVAREVEIIMLVKYESNLDNSTDQRQQKQPFVYQRS